MNLTKTTIFALASVIGLTAVGTVEAQHVERPLLLRQHTMTFAGRIAVDTHITADGDPDDGDTYATLDFFPWVGYFVIDNLEIMGSLEFVIPFNDWSKTIGFSFGAQYIWDFHVICLYLGGMVGFSWAVSDWPTSPDAFAVPTALFGLLVPFNRHVALDIGLRFYVTIPLDEDNPNDVTIDIPAGYLGVRSHFNFF